jgi:hypothetical protein
MRPPLSVGNRKSCGNAPQRGRLLQLIVLEGYFRQTGTDNGKG